MITANPIVEKSLLNQILEQNFRKWGKGVTGWMFGYRISPINGKPQFHNGIDLAMPEKTAIFSPWDGVVANLYSDVYKGKDSLNGNMVVLTHPDDDQHPIDETIFVHLHSWSKSLRVGSKVKAGEFIAYSGNTGASTGPHLHFMTKVLIPKVRGLEAVDPLPFLAAACGIAEIPVSQSGQKV